MASVNARNGKLYIDFRYFGKRCREQTLLVDNPANRKRLKNFANKIEAEINLNTVSIRPPPIAVAPSDEATTHPDPLE